MQYATNVKIFGLWDWQEVIVGSVLEIIRKTKKHLLVEVPTGHGKSVIICSLARTLYDTDPKCKIYITTQTSYLKHHLFVKYGEEEISLEYPDKGSDEQRIEFITFGDLCRLDE